MKTSSILDTYQTWLTHREYSPATIQKYTKALARFFADTGAGDIPTRETVAAWRDSLTEKGYTPATVNAMLAAVNDYQESIDNVAGKAKPLKHQRRIFADPGRELTRAEYFRLLNAARAAGNKRTQLLLEALCSTGTRVSELQFITAEAVRRHKASIRCKGKCREILLPAELCHRLTRWCQKHRILPKANGTNIPTIFICRDIVGKKSTTRTWIFFHYGVCSPLSFFKFIDLF